MAGRTLRTDDRLLANRLRPVAVGAIVLSSLAVLLLGGHYAHHRSAGAFDRAVDGWFVERASYRVALGFADLGSAPVVLMLAAVVLGLCVALRSGRGGALTAVAPAVASGITEWALKPLVHRTKDGYLAYPSGHVTGLCAVAFVAVLITSGPARRRLSRRAASWTASGVLLLALACAWGLVASGYHYASDVIGGIGVAGASVLAIALVVDAVADRVAERSRPAG
jgi:membrane-associated phospholipid phosphatase